MEDKEHTFELTIELGNAAMSNARDVADLLNTLATNIRDYHQGQVTRGTLQDRNGNTVARWVADFPEPEDDDANA